MKKPWLLIIAGVLLTTLIGIWLFLFFGGDDAREDLYNAFGLNGDDLPFGLDDFLEDGSASSTQQYLRQLSLRKTIGYAPLSASSTPTVVYLAEAGTGYIYKVDVASGQEERVSNITIPSAREASFSPDGFYAAITSDEGRTLTLITLPNASTTLLSTKINASPISTKFTVDGVLLYAIREGQSVKGYAYNVTTDTSSLIFTIPFREATIVWGNSVTGPHYTYPRSAKELEGYLYEINSSNISRLPISGFGLSASGNESVIAFSKIENAAYKSYVFEKISGRLYPAKNLFIPEKCVFTKKDTICAANFEPNEAATLERWHRGEIHFNDSLWLFAESSQDGLFLISLEAISSRQLDGVHLYIKDNDLYFINKTDGGLWLYSDDSNIKSS